MSDRVSPTTESAIRDAVLEATAQSTALRIIGGGTRGDRGASRALEVSALSGITRYEPGELTLEAKAGTPVAEIESALAAENQMLAFEPMDHRALLGTSGTPTIGGVVSCNVSGPRRFLSGACRDFLLGMRCVDGRGRFIKSGGRTMKNVTGLNMSRLFCGAYGTLGVLTEVSFKVLPKPERAATVRIDGLNADDAVALFCKALSTPYEVSGAAWHKGTATMRIEGLDTQVTYRLSQLQKMLGYRDGFVVEGERHRKIWSAIRDVHPFAQGCDTLWRISLKATTAPAFITAMHARLGAQALLDHGGALVWLCVPQDAPDQATLIRQALAPLGGYATLMRASVAMRQAIPTFPPLPPRLATLSEGIRRQFDPQGIFNPGLISA